MADPQLLDKVISLCKRRGFVFPGSEIYGGLANTYDYGPRGTALKRNLANLWWTEFVTKHPENYGLDTSILMSPSVWEASGHTANFTNLMIDCTACHYRTRTDHLIEDNIEGIGNVEGKPTEELDKLIADHKIKCPKCGKSSWTKTRAFNQLFETQVGIITSEKNTVYLRGELAQGMFVDFKQVLDSIHPRLPFGIAQSGKAFRNEITMGKFTFRTLEFDLAEFEYFVKPEEWEKWFDYWKEEMHKFALLVGLSEDKLRWRSHKKEELSHYSSRTEDLEYEFPWGHKEMWGLAYRTDFDLKNHMEKSGVDLRYTDPYTQEKFIPHVIEPTFGLSRLLTIILMNSYSEDKEKGRVVMKFPKALAPVKAAVFPLLGNKEELTGKAKEVLALLAGKIEVEWDDRGNIGKRYFAQDEIGTPYCITVDFQTLEDQPYRKGFHLTSFLNTFNINFVHMKIKSLIPLLIFALILSGCSKKATTTKTTPPAATKILVNELPFGERPFTVLVPHASNRVFTFYTQNADKAKTASLDLEYQSGDLLKGARASLDTPIPNPFVKAIVLGSCSTGGKCTFDSDLKSGTMKFRLDFEGKTEVHVLKGDFTFILGQQNLPDGKVIFEPSRTNLKDNLILVNSLGVPTQVEKEVVLYPIVISAVGNKTVLGTLTINQSGVTEAAIYDGTSFKPLKFTAKENTLTFTLNEKPWTKQVTITRDDQKGAQETLSLYLIGPIVLYK